MGENTLTKEQFIQQLVDAGWTRQELDRLTSYRCTEYTVYFHRERADKHFELNYVKAIRDKNNATLIVD